MYTPSPPGDIQTSHGGGMWGTAGNDQSSVTRELTLRERSLFVLAATAALWLFLGLLTVAAIRLPGQQ